MYCLSNLNLMNRAFLIIAVLCFTKANSQNELALATADSLYAMGNYAEAILQLEKAQYQLAGAADNFYKDDAEVLKLYDKFITLFGEKSRYYLLASTRVKDIKEALFFKEGK